MAEVKRGTGAALVGSLLTGNIPGAVAAGVAMVSSATGTDNPTEALEAFKSDPQTVVRLKELAVQEQDSIRKHLEEMTRLQLEDAQRAHTETQNTIRAGDVAEDRLGASDTSGAELAQSDCGDCLCDVERRESCGDR